MHNIFIIVMHISSCSPTQVILPNDVRVMSSYCGYDGSMFITERGSLLACGLNNYNKLGLNEHRGFLLQMKQFIAKVCYIRYYFYRL